MVIVYNDEHGVSIMKAGGTELISKLKKLGVVASMVTELHAKDDALDIIRRNYTGLPDANMNQISYFGDHAKFIYANWLK